MEGWRIANIDASKIMHIIIVLIVQNHEKTMQFANIS